MPPRPPRVPYTTLFRSPKRHAAPMPPTLTRRPVRSPIPLWAWALLHRADDTRPMIARATRTLIDHAATLGWRTPPTESYWPPRSEEHTSELQSLTNLVCPPDLPASPTRRSSDLRSATRRQCPRR